ncbi:Thioredoxin-like protein 1 [Conoideocrella luteorostrata]|uniref:Thioredoxin-like protein 1 n=1 Tax=Conoideocrella luteorostrata TaxID=1105319 RepID=A0AAJ0CFH6_9HYPO|nr:Thioredoxin-like protein 1 [Conoideocrella luteorostrata]
MSQPPVVISSKEQFDTILRTSKVVVADFFATWCEPCRQIAPLYEVLSKNLSRPNAVTFVKIDTEVNKAISEQYKITVLPTFLLFRDAKITKTVKGANLAELQNVLESLVTEVDSLGGEASSSSGSGGPWVGAEIPRGYSDITDQVEIRNCEVLNADEEAGPVKVLFESTQPGALDTRKGSAKDFVQSGADDQLLLFVPFQGTVKLHTLQVSAELFSMHALVVETATLIVMQITSLPEEGQDNVSRPEAVHLYINRPQNMDFDEADDSEPTQAITLKPEDWNSQGTTNISLRFVKFQKTTTLIVYVQKGIDGAEAIRLDRIRLIGEAGTKRDMGKLQKVGDDE